ncbi:MAG: hypothetical protein HY360_04090 [Verrucomicrobia bacterium]|nr:hypothetical protein [Verrucomicrobiota bacterium]
MKVFAPFILTLLLIAMPSGNRLGASGCYTGGPFVPPVQGKEQCLDSEKYEVGKQIFTGKMRLDAISDGDVEAMRKKLKIAQEQLPEHAQKTVDLPSLAGQLDPKQWNALAYYLLVRHKIKLDP